MDRCYLCNKEFNNIENRKHDEHIIQQSIGGNLTSYDILCHSCGNILGKEVDLPFSKIFESISTRLDIKKDRGTNNNIQIRGRYINLLVKLENLRWSNDRKKLKVKDYEYHFNKICSEIANIDVVWSNFKVSPLKPFYKYSRDKRKVFIYSNEKTAKKYIKKVKKEINFEYIDNKPYIQIIDDLDGIIQYEFPLTKNIDSLKKGLAKIAIGFASSHKIDRRNLDLVLDLNKNEIKKDIDIYPFIPMTLIDKVLEMNAMNFDNYPSHTLIMYSLPYSYEKSKKTKKILICYIELFSTIQYFIPLSFDYKGEDIYKYHLQQLLKKEDHIFKPDRRYYKERNIYFSQFNITEELINNRFKRQFVNLIKNIKWKSNNDVPFILLFNLSQKIKTKYEVEINIIQEEFIKQKYKTDFESACESKFHFFTNWFISRSDKEKLESSDMMNIYQNINMLYKISDEDKEEFNLENYRKLFYQDGNLKSIFFELISIPRDLTFKENLRAYHTLKYRMLEKLINKNILEKKLNIK